MFAKVFAQIFDSSIAENYRTRHVFMDILVLADAHGMVDMTTEAIARRTNVPVEEVKEAIRELCEPDRSSRTQVEEGRRLLPIDPQRTWGWMIVNYQHYRKIRDEESRREYIRQYRQKAREEARAEAQKKSKPIKSPARKHPDNVRELGPVGNSCARPTEPSEVPNQHKGL